MQAANKSELNCIFLSHIAYTELKTTSFGLSYIQNDFRLEERIQALSEIELAPSLSFPECPSKNNIPELLYSAT